MTAGRHLAVDGGNKGAWHCLLVHPLCTVWPRLGQLLHTIEEVTPEDPLLKLQWACAICDSPGVAAACLDLAECEPYGPYIPIKRTWRGTLHNLVADPLSVIMPQTSWKLHARLMDDDNPYESLVRSALAELSGDLHGIAVRAADKHFPHLVSRPHG